MNNEGQKLMFFFNMHHSSCMYIYIYLILNMLVFTTLTIFL